MDERDAKDERSVDVLQMLELQTSEIEMLQSMFPNSGEMELDDKTALVNIRNFLIGKIKYEYLYSRLGFRIKIAQKDCKSTIELVCQFPHEYPSVVPVVYARAPNMSRENYKRLNDDLQNFILNLERGELCILSVIEWIQENLDKYEMESELHKSNSVPQKEEDSILTRLWIYCHHIFSKFKRKDIIDWANELHLTGFSMPGKPGVICIEGYSRAVDEYWHRVRRLSWKRIIIKEKEEIDIGNNDINTFTKFKTFEEKIFGVRDGKGKEYHMDLGMLNDYLQEHGCGHVFQIYFGVEGKHCS